MTEIPKVPEQNIQHIVPQTGKTDPIPSPEKMSLPKTSKHEKSERSQMDKETLQKMEDTAMPESTIKKILGLVKKQP